MHLRTRLVCDYFLKVIFLVRALTVGYHGNGASANPNMVVFGNTQKVEGGLKFFISNFPSLSVRIVLNLLDHNEKKG